MQLKESRGTGGIRRPATQPARQNRRGCTASANRHGREAQGRHGKTLQGFAVRGWSFRSAFSIDEGLVYQRAQALAQR